MGNSIRIHIYEKSYFVKFDEIFVIKWKRTIYILWLKIPIIVVFAGRFYQYEEKQTIM